MQVWQQVYDPLSNAVLSTAAAAAPPLLLLGLIASGRIKPHVAALVALSTALLIATLIFTMPPGMAVRATLLGG